MRQLKPAFRWLYVGLMAVVLLLAIAYVFWGHRVVLVTRLDICFFAYAFALILPFVFILYPATKRASLKVIPWYDILLALLAFGSCLWVGLNALEASVEGWIITAPLHVALIGILVSGLLIEASRRTAGVVFALVVLLFTLLPYFSHYLPVPFTSPNFGLLIPSSFLLYAQTAIFGMIPAILWKLIMGFLIFGFTLQFLGGGEYFIKLALSVMGGVRGATAKVSIFSSGIFGMLSGSSAGNVVTTGTITIPAMKKSGYPPYYAGAVEACASTGGMIMPPVMGAVAFVMAELTQIPYAQIAMAAFIPGVLYFLALFIQSDFQSVKLGIKPVPKEERVRFSFKLLLEGADYFAAGAVLLYFIFGPQLVSQAPFWALLPLLIGGVIKKKITLKSTTNLISGFGDMLLSMIGLFLCLGLIMGSVTLTGFGLAISNLMYSVGAGNILLLVLLGGLVSMILGMGITVTTVYILVAILLCPALIKLGINIMSAHLFVIYYAAVAAITPPVAPVALMAAKLAGAEYFRTGFQAMRLGMVMFLVPLYFVHEPALVLQGTALELLISLSTCIFAIVIFSAGFERYMYFVGKISWPESITAVISGFLIILPIGSELTIAGWILSAVLIAYWIIKFLVTKSRAGSIA